MFTVRSEYRDDLKNYLKNNGIETLIYYLVPIHLQKAYEDLEYKIGDFPVAETISKTVLSLPICYGMNNKEINYVIDILNKW